MIEQSKQKTEGEKPAPKKAKQFGWPSMWSWLFFGILEGLIVVCLQKGKTINERASKLAKKLCEVIRKRNNLICLKIKLFHCENLRIHFTVIKLYEFQFEWLLCPLVLPRYETVVLFSLVILLYPKSTEMFGLPVLFFKLWSHYCCSGVSWEVGENILSNWKMTLKKSMPLHHTLR